MAISDSLEILWNLKTKTTFTSCPKSPSFKNTKIIIKTIIELKKFCIV